MAMICSCDVLLLTLLSGVTPRSCRGESVVRLLSLTTCRLFRMSTGRVGCGARRGRLEAHLAEVEEVVGVLQRGEWRGLVRGRRRKQAQDIDVRPGSSNGHPDHLITMAYIPSTLRLLPQQHVGRPGKWLVAT